MKGPLKGRVRARAKLSWRPIRSAQSYLVEIARDAEFGVDPQAHTVPAKQTRFSIPKGLSGKWFWRVSALDRQGFRGAGSKRYAFTIR